MNIPVDPLRFLRTAGSDEGDIHATGNQYRFLRPRQKLTCMLTYCTDYCYGFTRVLFSIERELSSAVVKNAERYPRHPPRVRARPCWLLPGTRQGCQHYFTALWMLSDCSQWLRCGTSVRAGWPASTAAFIVSRLRVKECPLSGVAPPLESC